jgi:quinol monooxygenase YgiN
MTKVAEVLGATSTTDDVLSGVNLRGKRIFVTGVSAGLGVETRVIKARAAADEGTTKLIPNNGQFTLINTYTVKPERAEKPIEFLTRATQETLRYVPGFISANLHLSLDRSKVVNYAQWVNAEATAAARQDPKVADLMRQELQIVESFNPLPFNLRSSVSAAPAK